MEDMTFWLPVSVSQVDLTTCLMAAGFFILCICAGIGIIIYAIKWKNGGKK